MTDIEINGYAKTIGSVSASQRKRKQEGSNIVIVENVGVLQCEEYYPKIFKIACSRFALENVEVTAESFGSDDANYVYEFTFKKIEVKKNG